MSTPSNAVTVAKNEPVSRQSLSKAEEMAMAEAIERKTCYNVFCHVCKTERPTTCSIAMEARIEAHYGPRFWQYYADYLPL